jgi:ArsR family transcriptional regulator
MYQLPLPDRSFAAVLLHQVLHFADDPLRVLTEAARVLGPGGRLVVVDLLNHGQEQLRTEKAHRRLGFGPGEMSAWFRELGLVEEPAVQVAGQGLTVMIWIARRPGAARAANIDVERRDAA